MFSRMEEYSDNLSAIVAFLTTHAVPISVLAAVVTIVLAATGVFAKVAKGLLWLGRRLFSSKTASAEPTTNSEILDRVEELGVTKTALSEEQRKSEEKDKVIAALEAQNAELLADKEQRQQVEEVVEALQFDATRQSEGAESVEVALTRTPLAVTPAHEPASIGRTHGPRIRSGATAVPAISSIQQRAPMAAVMEYAENDKNGLFHAVDGHVRAERKETHWRIDFGDLSGHLGMAAQRVELRIQSAKIGVRLFNRPSARSEAPDIAEIVLGGGR